MQTSLEQVYRNYIACLNAQDWPSLPRFVAADVVYNGRRFGVDGYRTMLEGNFDDIPDLRFNIGLLVVQPPYVAARLDFDCTPRGEFLNLALNGRRVAFTENVFYALEGGKITQVWSVVDKAAIEAQLIAGERSA